MIFIILPYPFPLELYIIEELQGVETKLYVF